MFQRPIARLSLNCDARNRSPIRNLRTETSNPTTETSNPTLATQDPERVSTSSSLALVILFGGWAWVSSVPAADSAPFFELHSMYYGEYGVARFVREGGRRERERGREREREATKHKQWLRERGGQRRVERRSYRQHQERVAVCTLHPAP